MRVCDAAFTVVEILSPLVNCLVLAYSTVTLSPKTEIFRIRHLRKLRPNVLSHVFIAADRPYRWFLIIAMMTNWLPGPLHQSSSSSGGGSGVSEIVTQCGAN